jgi:hypothetical protein
LTKKYVVTRTGTKNGKEYSCLLPIIQGDKENGDKYSFLDEKQALWEQEMIAVGTMLSYETTRSVEAQPSQVKPEATQNVGIRPNRSLGTGSRAAVVEG